MSENIAGGLDLAWLPVDEHEAARPLYRSCFPEDDISFVDYYFLYKAADNKICVLKDESGTIVSMLHLNPYTLHFFDKKLLSHYIVAVSTMQEYRRRGCMARLLQEAFSKLYAAREAFVYLEPADTRYYLPFGFRTVYKQHCCQLSFEEQNRIRRGLKRSRKLPASDRDKLFMMDASVLPIKELRKLSTFYNKTLSLMYDVFVRRTLEYWQNFQKELSSEGGRLCIVYKGESILGAFGYWLNEDTVEIREALSSSDDRDTLVAFMLDTVGGYKRQLTISGMYGAENMQGSILPEGALKDKIMMRIICLRKFLDRVRPEGEGQMIIKIDDPLLRENSGMFLWSWSDTGSSVEEYNGVRAPDITMNIGDFGEYVMKKFRVSINDVV